MSLGIAQLGHGKRSGLARLKRGDTLIYYSPTEKLGEKVALREFTAVGVVADDEIYQATEHDIGAMSDFRPFRRRVDWEDGVPVPVESLKDQLDLTNSPNWGYQLRRGLIELSDADAALIRAAHASH